MKNKNLWLTIIIAVGIAFLLTWILPSTNYDTNGKLVIGAINPTGIWDIFYYLSMLLSWFGQHVVFIIAMGVFYGVVSKTGALRVLEEKIVLYFKKREKIFLLISVAFFVIVSSLTGINFPLLIFVPLFLGVILSLGYSKITALLATIVPIIVGSMGSLYATSLYTAIAGYVQPGVAYGWYKLAMIIAGILVLGIYLYLTAKPVKGKDKEEIDEEILYIEKVDNSKKVKLWPLIIAFSLILVLFVLGLTPWANMYNFNGFVDFHNSLMSFKIGKLVIFKSILGPSAVAFGAWDIFDASTLLTIISLVLIFVYKIKWKEAFKSIGSSIVKLLPTIAIILLSNLVFVLVSQTGVLNTIINSLASLSKGMNVFVYSLVSFFGGVLVNESYVTSYIIGTLNSILGESTNLPLLVLIQQVMSGIAMIVAPTSVILLAGLSYLEVGYTKWVKNIWKVLLILLAVGLIILTLATYIK